MKKRLFTILLLLLISLTSVFCLDNTIPKSMNGTFQTFHNDKVISLYVDTEMENFIYFQIDINRKNFQNSKYYYFSGDISQSYLDDKEYTLHCYNEDSKYVGIINLYSVPKNNGLKVSIPKFGIISVNLDKVSNEYIPMEDVVLDVKDNLNTKYCQKKTSLNKTQKINYKKELDGSYLNNSEDYLTFLFIDKETEGFVFYRELYKENKYILLYGNVSQSYLDDKKYTLYCYNEDLKYVGITSMTMVYKDKGIKVSMNNLGIVGLDLEKISNEKVEYDDLSLYKK